jgi:RNA polymerase sigma-70 factor (ECF subfamily)
MTADDDVFEAQRPRLRSIAYRMLASMSDAEDVVQDAWLRWHRATVEEHVHVDNPAAWLTTTVTRLCLDRLKSAQRQREEYVGPWLPEPVITDEDPAHAIELAESLTLGFLAVLDRLDPVDRAVFLLSEVFDEPYAAIAPVVGRSEATCRQIASRARRRVRDQHRSVDRATRPDELVDAFITACMLGGLDDFRRVLAEDVVLVSDGGREVHAARRPVHGVARVARLMANLTRRLPDDLTVEAHWVNHEPGFVVSRGGAPWYVVVLEAHDGLVTHLRLVINPDKLRHLSDPPVL